MKVKIKASNATFSPSNPRQAQALADLADHVAAEGPVDVGEPVPASPHLPDGRGPGHGGEGAHLRAAASAAD